MGLQNSEGRRAGLVRAELVMGLQKLVSLCDSMLGVCEPARCDRGQHEGLEMGTALRQRQPC